MSTSLLLDYFMKGDNLARAKIKGLGIVDTQPFIFARDQIGRNFAFWATFEGPRQKFQDPKIAQKLGYFLGEILLPKIHHFY